MSTVETRILEVLSRTTMLPAESLARDKTLASLGIGSLEQIECILALEDDLHVELQDTDLWKLRTVGDVFDAVQRALDSRPDAPRT
jgi:acyl carrier protein